VPTHKKKPLPVLVTGGAGYIGSHVCKALHQNGFLPIVFDNFSQGHKYAIQWGPYLEGDLLDPKALQLAFTTYKPIAVMHFAASALVNESIMRPEKYFRNNTVGTLNLLESCVQHKICSLVFSSTCATYGISPTTPLSENCPRKPINPYGRSKFFIEEMLPDFEKAYGLHSISLRYFNAAGADPDQEIGENHFPETHLIPTVIHAALGLLPHISVYGCDFPTPDGSAIRDYIHVTDLANAHLLALFWLLENKQSLSLNLGTGTGLSVFQIIKEIEQYGKRFLKIKLEKRREGDPAILIADNKKAKQILGFEPKHSDIHTIIDSAWKWYASLSAEGTSLLPSLANAIP